MTGPFHLTLNDSESCCAIQPTKLPFVQVCRAGEMVAPAR